MPVSAIKVEWREQRGQRQVTGNGQWDECTLLREMLRAWGGLKTVRIHVKLARHIPDPPVEQHRRAPKHVFPPKLPSYLASWDCYVEYSSVVWCASQRQCVAEKHK